jgi:diketogulonate reductase-like aldo/keto reductase
VALRSSRGVRFAKGCNNIFSYLTVIGQTHSNWAAQVTLRWLIQRGTVVIPQHDPGGWRRTATSSSFEINDNEMPRIAEVGRRRHRFHNREVQIVSRIGRLADRWPDRHLAGPDTGFFIPRRKQP